MMTLAKTFPLAAEALIAALESLLPRS